MVYRILQMPPFRLCLHLAILQIVVEAIQLKTTKKMCSQKLFSWEEGM